MLSNTTSKPVHSQSGNGGCFGTSLIPRTTTDASLQQQRKPLQKTLPNFAQVDSKEGNLNGTDVVPLPVAVPVRLGTLVAVVEPKTQKEKELESLKKELEERKLALERREKEVEDRCRGLDDRERKAQINQVEIQMKIEGVERREKELNERRKEFENERENMPNMAEWKASIRAGLNDYLAMLT